MSLFEELKRRNVIRVAALYIVVGWLLVQVADVLFPWFGIPDWAGRLIVLVLVLGFPVAVVFAWAYEITPDGIKRESEVDPDRSIAPHTARKLDYITIGAVVLAVVFVFVERFTRAPVETPARETAAVSEPVAPVETAAGRPESSETSIAVLPFVNMSEDEANEYFSDGISEELLNLLVRVEGLRVPSRTSSFAFKGKDVDIPTIAEKLDVDHVLEGSVRKAGNTVRITAQLIDVSDDRHLWSDTYDRELEDIFAVQDEIATAIVDALKGLLGAAQATPVQHRPPTDNVEAYQLYLRARHIWSRRGVDNLKRSVDYFQQALELDPEFARALSGLASAYMLIPVYSGEGRDRYWPLARDIALRALEKDPDVGEANAVLAAIHENASEWMEAEKAFQAAIAADPYDVTATQWYAEFLYGAARFEKGLEMIRKAHDLDPLSPVVNSSLAHALIVNEKVEEAQRYAEIAVELGFGGNVNEYILFALLHITKEEYREAAAVFERGVKEGYVSLALDAAATRAMVEPAQRARAMELLAAEEPNAVRSGLSPGFYYTLLGATNEALAFLEQAAAVDEIWWPSYLWRSSEVRRDPRLMAVAEENGLIDYWRQYGWPSFCSETDGKVSCE